MSLAHRVVSLRSGLRRSAALVAAGLLTAAAVVGTAAPAAAQEPSGDITSYVLFGFEEVSFKGGQGNHGPSIIDGGNIGANGRGFVRAGDYRVNLCANAQMVMSDGTMVVGDTMRLGDSSTPTQECDVYEAFANISAPNNETPRTGPAHPFTPPPVKATPPFPDFDCDAANPFTVERGETVTMPPGVYGAVDFQNGSTVTLEAGTYTVCDWTTGQNVTVLTPATGGVVIQSASRFITGDGTAFDGPNCETIPMVYVRADGVGANDRAVRFGQDSEIWGHFYTPRGALNLGNQTDLHGTFWARAIASDFNVDIEYCPPPIEPPDTGEFAVTKRVTGDDAGLPADATFTVHYNCTIPGPGVRDALDGSFEIGAGQTLALTDVQVGTTCTVTEVEVPDPLPGFVFDPPVVTPQTFTIEEEGQLVEVVVENPMREVFGTIQVHKEVSGDPAGYLPGTEFGLDLDCDADAFDTSFTLAAGETFTSDPIRVGVSCTVAETMLPDPAPGFAWLDPTFTPDPARVVIGSENQVVTVDVDNRVVENVGRIRVRKDVTGELDGYVGGSTFGFALDCDDDTFDTTFDLVDGEAFTTGDLPVGTTCEVSETDLPDPAAGFTWAAPVYTPDPATVTVTEAGQLVLVGVENPLVGRGPPVPPGPGIGGPSAPPAAGSIPDAGGPSRWLLAVAAGLVLAGTSLLASGRTGRRPG